MHVDIPADHPYGAYENDPRQALLTMVLLAVAAVVSVILITLVVMKA
ncbi:MAG TPA: hypothetical protein VFQ53_13505 [Kofleriaceae bacterium]|nr:hypothetical protein [Kofleriaceae bacterium]